MKSIRGTGVALVTPFDNKGQIDFEALAKLIEHCIKGGVEFLVSMGTTGETPTLTKEEKKEILDFTKKTVNKRVMLVAGFGGNDTVSIAEELNNFDHKGYSYILSASPYYNKPSQEGIYQHYKYLAAASPLPIILYNVPGRTSSNISAETTLRLAKEVDNIVGIKEASGNIDQMMKIIKNKPKNFSVLSGDDNLVPSQIAIGADGVISVIANALPKKYSDMVRLCLKNDFEKAAPEHLAMIDFIDLLFLEGNPVGVKTVLNLMGICKDNLRLPLVKGSVDLREKLKKEMILLQS